MTNYIDIWIYPTYSQSPYKNNYDFIKMTTLKKEKEAHFKVDTPRDRNNILSWKFYVIVMT